MFLVVGGACAAVNFGTGAVIRSIWDGRIAYASSVAVGFTAGAALSFVLNRRYTFRVDRAPVGPQALRFTILSFAAVVLSAAVAETVLAALQLVASPQVAAVRLAGIAHVVTIGMMTIFNFFAMKFFALRETEPQPDGVAAPVIGGGGNAAVGRADLDTPKPLC